MGETIKKTTTKKRTTAKPAGTSRKTTTTRKKSMKKKALVEKKPSRSTIVLQTESQDNDFLPREDRHIGFYRNIAVGFFIITVLLFAAIFFTSVRSATVTITYVPEEFSFADVVALAPERDDQKTIAGMVDVTQVSIEEVFTPNGVAQEEVPILGVVDLVNEYSKDQPLVRTTRLFSVDGIMYRLDESVVVPAGGRLEDVPVYADVPGPVSDMDAGRLTIPGLWEPLQEVIYAVAKEDLVGGIVEYGVISPEDMQAAERKIRERLLADAEVLAKEKVNPAASHLDGMIVSLDGLEINRSSEIGDRVEEFIVQARANAVVARYQNAELQEVVRARLQQEQVPEYVSLQFPNEGPSVRVESYNVDAGTAQLSILTEMKKVPNSDAQIFVDENFLGKNALEVDQLMAGLDEFERIGADVNFFPRWVTTIPSVGGVVKVEFDEVAETTEE